MKEEDVIHALIKYYLKNLKPKEAVKLGGLTALLFLNLKLESTIR